VESMKNRSHCSAMVECFRANPSYAKQLLAEVRRNGDPAELAILLRQMATASADDARSDDADTGRTLAR
jgi:DNA-binding phage protein